MNPTFPPKRPDAEPSPWTSRRTSVPLWNAVPNGATIRPPGRVCSTHAYGTRCTAAAIPVIGGTRRETGHAVAAENREVVTSAGQCFTRGLGQHRVNLDRGRPTVAEPFGQQGGVP